MNLRTFDYTEHIIYDLPGIDRHISIPEGYTNFDIKFRGGGGSASIVDGKIYNGGEGGIVSLSLKVLKDDKLSMRLGNGGCGGPVNKDYKFIKGASGRSSYILLNGNIIASAYGAVGNQGGDGFVEKNDKIVKSCITRGNDGHSGGIDEGTHSYLIDYTDFNGEKGKGGLCKVYKDDIIYLGNGGRTILKIKMNSFNFNVLKLNEVAC